MEEQILFRFIKLNLNQFASFVDAYVAEEMSLELSSSFQFSYNFDNNVVCCTTTVIITNETNAVLKAELNSYFNIQSKSADSMMEGDCIVLPIDLMAQFASLGYGSMRGVIYAKTMGTPLEKIILPPNDIQNIFTAPVKFRR